MSLPLKESKSMMSCKKGARRDNKTDLYATKDEFCRMFSQEIDDLYRLAYLLTADHEMAERSFVAGLDDSVHASNVFNEWALSWARRAIIKNAIHEVQPQPPASGSLGSERIAGQKHGPQPGFSLHPNLGNVLHLPAFDRFAFIMSVLEESSDRDCALLLGCPPEEIQRATVRAIEQLAGSALRARPDDASGDLDSDETAVTASPGDDRAARL